MILALINGWDLVLWIFLVFVALVCIVYGAELVVSWRIERRRRAARRRDEETRQRRRAWVRDLARDAKRTVKRANRELGIKLHVRANDATCPLCMTGVEDELHCDSCGADFHAECMAEMGRSDGRCPTLGCGGTPR